MDIHMVATVMTMDMVTATIIIQKVRTSHIKLQEEYCESLTVR